MLLAAIRCPPPLPTYSCTQCCDTAWCLPIPAPRLSTMPPHRTRRRRKIELGNALSKAAAAFRTRPFASAGSTPPLRLSWFNPTPSPQLVQPRPLTLCLTSDLLMAGTAYFGRRSSTWRTR